MKAPAPPGTHTGPDPDEELAGRASTVPQTLEDLLRGYDVQKIGMLTHGFRVDAPAGKELI